MNPLNSNLATVASHAAVELDLRIIGEQTELNSVSELIDRLSELLKSPSSDQEAAPEQARALLADTETQTILGRAFTNVGENPASILNNLFAKTDEIVNKLTDGDREASELESLRAFCLALSKSASSLNEMVVDTSPVHPDRRD